MFVGGSVGSVSFVVIGVVIGLLPAVAGIRLATHPAHSPMGEALLVFGWTLLATLTVAASGAARSAAVILFAIGPFTAFVLRRNRLAIESAVLGVLAYLAVAALGSFDLVPTMSERQSTLGGAAGAMGVIQMLMLIWAAAEERARSLQPAAAVAPATSPPANQQAPDLAAKAQRMLKERTTYFASLSHDLRSPFTAILGYAEQFKMNLRGNLTDKQVDQASIIHESAEDLLSLVDDMMDLAKSEAGKLTIDPEPIHLGDLGSAIMEQMQAMADRKKVELKIDTYGEPWAMADARLVRRIWQNLISNAIKYSDTGGLVQLSTSERARQVVLSVRDNGRGMTEEDLTRIAEPFAMGDNSNDKAGTGLGLVNVKRFADMHGGQVMIDTAPGEGAHFQVILPKADISLLEPL